MALGAITLTFETESGYAPMRYAEFTVVADDNYTAGGTVAIDATLRTAFEAQRSREGSLSNLRLNTVTSIDGLAFDIRFDRGNVKLIVRNLSDGLEVAGDQSAQTYRIATLWS